MNPASEIIAAIALFGMIILVGWGIVHAFNVLMSN